MADATTPTEGVDIDVPEQRQITLDEAIDFMLDYEQKQFPEDKRDQLSLVLFPTTHTKDAEVLGKVRSFTPLPLKFAKQISKALHKLTVDLQPLMQNDVFINIEEVACDKMLAACKIIADYYKWDDVTAAIDDEMVSTTDLQNMVVTQLRIQGTNDFLLKTLRLLVKTMQLNELVAVRLAQK